MQVRVWPPLDRAQTHLMAQLDKRVEVKQDGHPNVPWQEHILAFYVSAMFVRFSFTPKIIITFTYKMFVAHIFWKDNSNISEDLDHVLRF